MRHFRNIAIISHVDHGKTSLIDTLLKQSGTFRDNQNVDERVMDSNDLEKERGITILAKCTSLEWKDDKINIIDTPGHADFGGEVERVLSMADGALLLVDSAEGPMPQTKFVLSKALNLGLKPIVVINKMDRPDKRPDDVLDEIFDLFVSLDANEDQLDFPVLYAAGRDGWCVEDMEHPQENLHPLLNKIIEHVTPRKLDTDAPFSMLVTLLESDPFLGRILTGLVYSGTAKINMPVKSINLQGVRLEQNKLTKLLTFDGLQRVATEEVQAGDIVAIAGLSETSVSDTICDLSVDTPIPSTPIDPPTMSITLQVNDSPLAGQDGDKLTSRIIRDRLLAEAESNVAITVEENKESGSFNVGGRGELQLGVLIETMRREGFELSVSRPHVIFQKDESTGSKLEPIEEVIIDLEEEYSGVVIEVMGLRKAEMTDMVPSGQGKTRLRFLAPSRGLIGYQSQFMTDTKGTGVLNRLFHSYAPYKGAISSRRNGALVSLEQGQAVGYALWNLEDRGILFVEPQEDVYNGMIVGEHSRTNDLEVNVLKGKKLTNVRASGSDENIQLSPPQKMSLEEMIAYIDEDELVEVTPKHLRLRKKHLNSNDRRRAEKQKKMEMQ